LQYGVTQKEICDNYDFSIRKVRDVANSPEWKKGRCKNGWWKITN
jgi:hypothetical protein